MLSYSHQYHAGNFADLHKQLVLTKILNYLTEKNKPFSIIDTHAGEGYYRLSNTMVKNSPELSSGLGVFFNHIHIIPFLKNPSTPSLINNYTQLLQNWNPNTTLEKIPGSPLLLSHFLRQDSTLTICEKHPSAFAKLEANFSPKNRHINILYTDGYQAIKAYLPPKEKRGLIFIDPSYEEKLEYQHIAECLTACLKRLSTGIYLIWYPILNNRPRDGINWLIKKMLTLPIRSLWQHEWHLEPELDPKTSGFYALQGSGLLCIHLPWQADLELNMNFDWLNTHIFPGRKLKHTWLKQLD